MEETVEIQSGTGEPTGSVIWLHGLGADGHDFEPIVPELRLDARLPLRFVFPHAPVRPVTINGGVAMRAWFDIVSLEQKGPIDESGLRESTALLEALIERERSRGIAAERIVVAGFSQGGTIALRLALQSRAAIAGIMALSTYLPHGEATARDALEHPDAPHRELPIFMAHGQFDPVLPIALGRNSRELLESLGFQVEWHEYPMAHAVCPQEIGDIRHWLIERFHAVE